MKLKEVWKDILGYEGLYQVSNWGRVKSLNYNRTGNERILKPGLGNRGYYFVNLCKNGKQKSVHIHRLVAEAFLCKIPKGLVVNHLNQNKQDNRLENLEIVTQKENLNHGTCRTRMSAAKRGKKIGPLSEETKQKISASCKRYWQKRKEA